MQSIGGWQLSDVMSYLGVMLAAAIPWFELFAIPPAIALGLSPILVGILAALSNAAVTLSVIFGWERLGLWWQRRTGRYLVIGSRRGERGRRVFERFGVPGLALQGPVLSGMYFAAILALGLGGERRSVVIWSLVSIGLWSALLVGIAVAGFSLF